jgi:hypothetical protein
MFLVEENRSALQSGFYFSVNLVGGGESQHNVYYAPFAEIELNVTLVI